MDIDKICSLVSSEMTDVEKALISNINSNVTLIDEVIRYLISSGGKRLRPLLLILASKLNGGIAKNYKELSVIIEYLHNATLLHDDIIDGAKYRRGQIAANNHYGNDVAVLCGDFLYSRSYIMLTDINDNMIQKILSKTALKMSEGEVFQLIKTADINLKFDEYMQIIGSKTAVLFSAACEVGCRSAGMDETSAKLLSQFGENIGIAFQMSDDMLDYLGDEEKLGKKNGTDLNEGKITLPLIILLKNASIDERKIIEDIILNTERNEQDFHVIKKMLIEKNIAKEADTVIDHYINISLKTLEPFKDSEYKTALINLAKHLTNRDR